MLVYSRFEMGPTEEAALARALAESGIEEAYRESVRELLDRADADMPRCCDGDCAPCVTALIRAALRVRQLVAAGQAP